MRFSRRPNPQELRILPRDKGIAVRSAESHNRQDELWALRRHRMAVAR